MIPTAAVKETTGLRTTSLYKAIKTLGFPAPCKVGRCSLWVESEVQDWLAKRVEERDIRVRVETVRKANAAARAEVAHG